MHQRKLSVVGVAGRGQNLTKGLDLEKVLPVAAIMVGANRMVVMSAGVVGTIGRVNGKILELKLEIPLKMPLRNVKTWHQRYPTLGDRTRVLTGVDTRG